MDSRRITLETAPNAFPCGQSITISCRFKCRTCNTDKYAHRLGLQTTL